MATNAARLVALENVTMARHGHMTFFTSALAPGIYWQGGADYRSLLHGEDGGAPSDVSLFTQAQVDRAALTHHVLIVRWQAYDDLTP